jgi:hypothetical protein
LLILLTALAFRDARQSKPALFAGLLSLSAAALLLGTPHPELQLPIIAHTIVRFLDIPSVGWPGGLVVRCLKMISNLLDSNGRL